MKPLGLYIHIPFCHYRCHYCDFLSFAGKEELIPLYVENLLEDIKSFSRKYQDHKVVTIFFGGGTPSVLSSLQIHTMLSSISRFFSVEPDAEITVESNPGTIDQEKLSGYRAAGINRLSIGVQAFQDRHLLRMGRIHTVKEAKEAFLAARDSGFRNINLDLIFGLPDQTLDEWKETLQEILAWNPEHVSSYGLQVEEGTPFSGDLKGGNLPVPDEEIQLLMFEEAVRTLAQSGYEHYEISNFARPGFRCRHNLIYWNNEEYLGIGLGAVSYTNRERFWMTRNLAKYLQGEERIVGSEILPVEGEMGETMMLGLRLREGVSSKKFRERFGRDLHRTYQGTISKFESLRFLKWKNGNLCLTSSGLPVANEIIQEFLQKNPMAPDPEGQERLQAPH